MIIYVPPIVAISIGPHQHRDQRDRVAETSNVNNKRENAANVVSPGRLSR